MGLKIRNDISESRAYIVILLICVEAFLTPISGSLSSGLWPTAIQICSYAVTAVLQALTLLIAFFERV